MGETKRGKRKFSELQREAIAAAYKRHGSAGRARAALAKGYGDYAPFDVSEPTIREVSREVARERRELYNTKLSDLHEGEAVDHLLDRMLGIAEREVNRLDKRQAQGKMDARQLSNLAGALERIGRAVDIRSAGAGAKGGSAVKKPDSQEGAEPGGEAVPPTFAEQLLEREGEEEAEPQPAAPTRAPAPVVADVKVSPAGRAPGRQPARDREAVPTPAPPQTTATPGPESDTREGEPETTLEDGGDPIPGQVDGANTSSPLPTSSAPIPA